jgi:hypothetical protein
VTEKTAGTRPAAGTGEQTAGARAATEFERLYRANVDAVTARHKVQGLVGRRDLDEDQVEELLERIDAERAGRGAPTDGHSAPTSNRQHSHQPDQG